MTKLFDTADRQVVFLALPFLFFSFSSFLSAQTTMLPSPKSVGTVTVLKQRFLPNDTTLTELSNGLTVIIQENHTAPVASVRCFVKNTGSAFERQWLGSGISHLLEHLVAGGTTTKRTEKEIEHLVERMGGVTNAFTSDDITCYFIDSTADQTPTMIELVADMMQHVVFEPKEFEREHKVVQQELQDGLNDRRRVLWNLLVQTVYLESTARHPIIGYPDILAKLTREDVLAFYKERYVPNNMAFVVVGDVKKDEVLSQVIKNFAGTPRGNETLIPLAEEPLQITPREAVREMDGQSFNVVLSWPTVKLSDPDLFALDVASYILAEGESSRFVRKLVYEQQLLLSANVYSSTPHFVTGQFCAMAVAMPENWEKGMNAMLAEIERLKTIPVTVEELNKAKKMKEAELIFAQQTVRDIAGSIGRNYFATGDPLFDIQYVEGIRKVTLEDVRRVAQKYFVPERLSTIVIAPPGMAPHKKQDASDISRHETKLVALPNGMRVLLKRQANLPLVNVQALVFGSTLTENEATAGQSALLAAMLDKGTPSKNAEQIAEYFDAIGGTMGIASGRNTIYGSTTVLKADFEAATRLFAECFLQSTFPEKEFEQVRTLALGAIARRSDNPISELMELFTQSLPPGSPYSRMEDGSAESVGKTHVEMLKKRHAEQFVPSNMVVAVFGDVEMENALEIVEATFGKLRQPNDPAVKEAVAKLEAIESHPAGSTIVASKDLHKTTAKDSGVVLLAWNAPSIYEGKEYAALRVLSAILSDGSGPNGWLFNELRGEGLVYRVNTALRSGPVAGFFIAMAQTKPESINEVVERILKSTDRAKAGEIPTDDFERAKERLISRHKQSNVTIGEQAMQAGLDELYRLGYNYDKTYSERIAAVTLDEVVAVARKYLGERIIVSTSPKEKR